jgi:hypothetical protein
MDKLFQGQGRVHGQERSFIITHGRKESATSDEIEKRNGKEKCNVWIGMDWIGIEMEWNVKEREICPFGG